MRQRKPLMLALFLVATLSAPAQSSPAVSTASTADEAWNLEEAYWRYRKANDVAKFRSLWHPRALGWPTPSAPPVGTDQLIEWAFGLGRIVEYELNREAVEIYGDTATIYYRVSFVSEAGSKRSTYRARIVHTLQKANGSWQIIGGMAAELPSGSTTSPETASRP